MFIYTTNEQGMFLIFLQNIFNALNFAITLFENTNEKRKSINQYFYTEINGMDVFKAHYFQIVYDDNNASGIYPIYSKNINKVFIKYEKSNYINRYKLKHKTMYIFLKLWYNFWIKNNQYLVNSIIGNKALKCSYYDVNKEKCKYYYDNERIRDGLIIVLERTNFRLHLRRSNPTFDRVAQKLFQIILYDEKKNLLGITHGAPY